MAEPKPTDYPITMMVLLGVGRVVERLTQPQFLLALLSTALLWWLTRELIGGRVVETMREVVSVLVGFITGQMVGPGWQFYFGTTKASEEKTTALAHNARKAMDAGIDLGQGGVPKQPVDVNVVNPYDGKTDEELRLILADRNEEAHGLDRQTMLSRLAELDAPGAGEVKP